MYLEAVFCFYVLLYHFVGHSFLGLVLFGSFSDIIKRNFSLTFAKLNFYVDMSVWLFVGKQYYRLNLCIVVQTYFHIFLYDRELEFDGFQPLSVRLPFLKDMYAELTKGQDVTKPNITPEMVAEAITGSVSGMEGVDPEALKQFNQALIGLLTVKPTEDEHDGS